MKKNMLMILAFLVAFPAMAQIDLFEQLTEKYSNSDGFSASRITSDMFELYLKKKNIDENSPVFEALKNLDKILVVSQSNFKMNPLSESPANGSTNNVQEIHKAILDYYQNNNYILFKTENRMGEDLKVFLKKNQKKTEALALITNSSVSTNLVELRGDIDLSTVSELNKSMNLKGLESLYKLYNTDGYFESSFLPYTGYSKEKIEELVARQREMVEKQKYLSDEQRLKLKAQAREMKQQQLEMAEKYRQMAEKYQRQPFFLTPPGDTNTVYYIDGKKATIEDVKKLDNNFEQIEINKAKKKDDKTIIRFKTK